MTPDDSARNRKMRKMMSLSCSICLMPIFGVGKVYRIWTPKGGPPQFAPPPNPRLTWLAKQHRQHKKGGQLIPQFFHLHWYPRNYKGVLAAQLVGRRSWRRGQTAGVDSIPRWSTGKPQVVICRKATGAGQKKNKIYKKSFLLPIMENIRKNFSCHTPQRTSWWEHGTRLKSSQRKLRMLSTYGRMRSEQNYERCHRACLQSDPKLVLIERRKNLLKARILAKQLEGDEKSLHESFPESVEKVVSDKKILLWQTLLERNGYDDMEVVKFMKYGVPLVGTHDHPLCYPLKPKLASLTEAELRS